MTVDDSHRQKYGDYFGIAVAGYPEAHPDRIVSDPEEMKKNYWADIHYLKQKVHKTVTHWLLAEKGRRCTDVLPAVVVPEVHFI